MRDTKDSVEVLLLRQSGDGIALLPWVGNEAVRCGAHVPANNEPSSSLAQLILQSAVRLPSSVFGKASDLVIELDKRAGNLTDAWRGATWLLGCHPLVLEEESLNGPDNMLYTTTIGGFQIGYSREEGLTIAAVNSDEGS